MARRAFRPQLRIRLFALNPANLYARTMRITPPNGRLAVFIVFCYRSFTHGRVSNR
ncbi:hypothetical protein BMETH_670_0 [methanotrophic bacterial endosymbiont of Bathymodiolus sp.]|nr:hypothetical protein BMETH_670_0 [methanotrophic bacterial endosymbiont of Bathymodiolus sp.]